MMNIAQYVERGAQLFPERLALLFEGEAFSYAQINAESNRAANGFAALGVRRGDRVAIWLPNTAAFVIAYLGVQKLGAVAVTINNALKPAELEFIINDSGACLLLTTAALYADLAGVALPTLRHVLVIEGEGAGALAFADLLSAADPTYPCAATAPTDPAALLYTSGTTGFPKGALLSHQTIEVSAQLTVSTLGLQPTDRILLCLSLFHGFPQMAAFNPCFAVGATLILHRQFAVEPVLHSLRTEAPTVFFGVPTIYIVLAEQATPAQLQSVRRYISGGAPLPMAVARQWVEKFGTAVNDGYGLTEIVWGCFNPDPLAKPGSVGRPLAGIDLRIVDPEGEAVAPGESGEVLIQTPAVMLGYWNRPVETAEVLRNGWFHTGDMGRVDEDGYCYIMDRIKDMVNVGGVKVYPSEVEQILYQHPAVKEVAVYGVPEPLLGEQVRATVVLRAEQIVTPQALIDFCRERLAEFKVPTLVDFVDQLPKNRTGKILKRFLREQRQAALSVPPTNGHLPNALVPLTLVQNGKAEFAQKLANAPTADRLAHLKGYVQEVVTQLLGKTPDDQESFFNFGLDSLLSIQLANRLAAALEIALPATLAFKYGTIDDLAQFLAERLGYAPDGARLTAPATNQATSAPISQPVVQLMDWYPQLYNQRECFIWHENVTNQACMHIQQTVHIQSPVDVGVLEEAFQALLVRHEALRTVYTQCDGALLQRVLPTQRVDFAAFDVTHQPWSIMAERVLETAHQPFDLAQGPLLRARLFSRGAKDHLLLFVVHHIVADATAMSIIVNELWVLYGALQKGEALPLPPAKPSWTEFVGRQLALLQGAEGERLWHYWRKQIADAPVHLNLPTDYPRPAQDSHHGRPCYFEIEAALVRDLRQLAQHEGCTLYAVLMAGFQLLLHSYSQQRDLLIAAHVANRNEADLAEVVGYLADTFPIRAHIPAEATFQSLVQQVQATLLAAMEHQGFPLRLLAERLGVTPEPTQTALCQVWFTLLPLRLFRESGALFQPGAGAIELGGLILEGIELVPAWLGAWYDLEMILTEGENVVFGTLVYKTDLFAETTVLRIIADFQALLKTIALNPALPLTTELLALTERAKG